MGMMNCFGPFRKFIKFAAWAITFYSSPSSQEKCIMIICYDY